MQISSNMLQQETSMSLSYFTGLMIKVILLGRAKSEGICFSVHWFAYAACNDNFSAVLWGWGSASKNGNRSMASATVPCPLSQRRDSRTYFHQWNQAGWPVSFPLHYPEHIKKNLLSHALCVQLLKEFRDRCYRKADSTIRLPSRSIPASLHWESMRCLVLQK